MAKKLTLLLLIVLLVSCNKQSAKESEVIFALDTVISIECTGKASKKAIEESSDYISKAESQLSRTLPSSEIYQLNRDGLKLNISDISLNLINQAFYYNYFTNGAFDITIAPISDLWGFTKDKFQVPAIDKINNLLPSIGMEHISVKNKDIYLDEGAKIDLGGIAKGLLAQEIKKIYQNNQIDSGYVNLGGDLLVYKNNPDHQEWTVGIQNPNKESESQTIGNVKLTNSYIFTSGNYQRYFEDNGKKYHHIINPKTGFPADNELVSVTIISKADGNNGIMCDALSTGLFILGKEKSINLYKEHQNMFDMILITNQNEVLISKGIKDIFILTDNEYQLIDIN